MLDYPYVLMCVCTLQPPTLSVGFVTNNGTAVTNYISTGASTLFPQGACCMSPHHSLCSWCPCPHAGAVCMRRSHPLPAEPGLRARHVHHLLQQRRPWHTGARRSAVNRACPWEPSPRVLTAQRPLQVVGPALAKLPVFGASLGLSANSSNSLMRGVPATAFVDTSDPACAARCKVSATGPPAAVGGR